VARLQINARHVMTMLLTSSKQWQPEGDRNIIALTTSSPG